VEVRKIVRNVLLHLALCKKSNHLLKGDGGNLTQQFDFEVKTNNDKFHLVMPPLYPSELAECPVLVCKKSLRLAGKLDLA